LRFSRKRQDGFAPNFLGFRRKHLFITNYIAKQCTRPLSFMLPSTYTCGFHTW